jgi:hypothetical protein
MTKGRVGFVSLGILGGIAFAQTSRLKPGLWEAASEMNMGDVASMIPQDKLAKMTPEQRAQVEAMMKRSASTPMSTKLCYTKEQLDKGLNYNMERAGTCTSKTISNNGSKQVSEISCDSAKAKTTGTVSMEAIDPEHYAGVVQMHSVSNGQPRDMTIKVTGKWLGSNCGDVKPLDYSKQPPN